MIIMVIGDTGGCGGAMKYTFVAADILHPRPLLTLQNQNNAEIRMEEINIGRVKSPVSCLIAGLS